MSPKEKDEREREEEEFVKVDKRAPRDVAEPTEPAAAPAGADSQPQPTPEPEPRPPASEEERAELTVYNLLRMTVGMFAEQAWIHLGLRVDPGTGKTEANLPFAKVAIDTVSFMVEQLQPDLGSQDKRELEAVLANLRINYVQRT
jgi:hypothetical protein